jgi:hypothetical protein
MAGVYHFGLECPSGKLSGFLALWKIRLLEEDARVTTGCNEIETLGQNPKISYSLRSKVGL